MMNYRCIYTKGVVKKCSMLKIVHDKYRSSKKTDTIVQEFIHSFDDAIEYNKEIEAHLGKTQVSLLYQKSCCVALFMW
jgi:DNA-directed RNA polymerase III subunit RPC1